MTRLPATPAIGPGKPTPRPPGINNITRPCYIRHFSFTLDASIALKTIHVMLFGKGS